MKSFVRLTLVSSLFQRNFVLRCNLVLIVRKNSPNLTFSGNCQAHAKRTGIPAEHRQGMGGTIILWEALRGGQIDVYPEYTGTIAQEILRTERQLSVQEIRMRDEIRRRMTEPLGF